jgi:hypothetical protein
LTSRTFLRAWMFLAGLLPLTSIPDMALRYGPGNPVLIATETACGYTLKPNQNVFRFFSHTHVSHDGVSSAEVASRPAPNTLPILFVGDSIPHGTSRIDQKQIFAEILHRDLAFTLHRPVEVLNASAGAWAVAHLVAMLDLTPAELQYSAREITLNKVQFNAKGRRIAADAIEKMWPELVVR